MRLKALGSALLLGWTAHAYAQAAAAPTFKFEMHGFTSVTGFYQDANTGPSEGQQSLWSDSKRTTDKASLGFDVRQTRLNLSVSGPQVMGGATPKAVVEMDFFGGFSAGGYGSVSLLPRLRLAYTELNWGKNRIDFGQLIDLTFAMAPTSLAHIAFPYSYMSGNIGWRRPGVFGFHTFDAGGPKVEFAWEIGRSQWADASSFTANGGIGGNAFSAPGGASLGEASALPAVQARLTLSSGTSWSAFAAGHWNRVDLNGVNDAVSNNRDVLALVVGGKVVAGPLTVAATGYTGKNLAPLLGDFLYFQPATAGDIHEYAGWVQAGFNFTKELSLWGYLGTDRPSEKDVLAAAGTDNVKTRNSTAAAMLQYRDGGYALGLEWVEFRTHHVLTTGSENVIGNQYMVSANYFF